MVRYIAGRVLQGIVSLIIIATLVFALVRLTGDPVTVLVPDYAPEALQEKIRTSLGLDQPLIVQYLSYLGSLARLDFGVSFATGRPVSDMLAERWPATLTLSLLALGVAVLLSLPLGIVAGVRKGTWLDTVARGVAVLGQSVPTFWLSLLLISIFAVTLSMFPVASTGGAGSYVLPSIALGWAAVAGIVRLTRSSMIEAMSSDYVRMARAKGLSPQAIVVKHAFRNSVVPVLTFIGLVIAGFMNGSVVVESVFAWPGIGTLALSAVSARDFPVVQGAVITISMFVIVIGIVVDVLYVLLDPRIRLK